MAGGGVTSTATESRPPRVNPAALAQKVGQQLRRHYAEPNPVLLVRAEPIWPYPAELVLADGRRLAVVPCGSVLAIWEQVTRDRDQGVVLLTDLAERELGTGILTEVFRQKSIEVQPWDLVAESFGAQRIDPRLEDETWAGEALVDAMPAGGWPPLAGTVLSRDVALRHLAAVRLGLERLELAPDDLDAHALLRWSTLPAGPEAFGRLRQVERDGLLAWLTGEFGRPAKVLAALLGAGHAADALPLGLVCQAVWAADDPDGLRAQGRVEQYLGGGGFDAATIRAYAEAAAEAVRDLLRGTRSGDTIDRRLGYAVLDRAEELLVQFGAGTTARHSGILRSGFEHRVGLVAQALTAASTVSTPDRVRAADQAMIELTLHALADIQPHRVERARMALRLLRWLGEPDEPPESVAAGIRWQIAHWGWVDRALAHVWAGEDVHPGLKAVFRAIHDRGRDRRRELDRVFAQGLSIWTAAGTPPGDLLTVEALLARVVAPLVRHGDRPAMLVVIDGMGAAVAIDLAEDLIRQGWVEHDPMAGTGDVEPCRHGAVAGLPTVTTASRMSLLAGAVRVGGQDEERATFAALPLWRGHPARLFHESQVEGGAGEALGEGLVEALSDPDNLIGVVINTVDEALDHGRESADAGWQVAQLGPLRALLDHARSQGRAVIITSDHGHVLEHDGVLRHADAPASARHRTDAAPPADGEVELAGPRVLADGKRVVALWDPEVRYLPQRAGYHGGASLAEVTVPVLAFLPLGAGAPAGWAPLAGQQPAWWTAQSDSPPAAAAAEPMPTQPTRAPRKGSRAKTEPRAEALFELAAPQASQRPPAPGPESLVHAVLASEMFSAQHALTPRKMPPVKIHGALTALVEANGVLPTIVVAQRAGEHPARATGFLTTLQHIFNVDNYPVLSLMDDGRTVRLDLALLRQQFVVGEGL
jgi:hypothetical protein